MTDDKFERVFQKHRDARQSIEAERGEARAREQAAKERALQAAQLWPVQRGKLEQALDELNGQFAAVGTQLSLADTGWGVSDQLASLEIGYANRKPGWPTLEVKVGTDGKIAIKGPSGSMSSTYEDALDVISLKPGDWRNMLLTFLDLNPPRA